MAPYMWKALYKILKAEKDVYAEALNLSNRKADAVMQGSIEDLECIMELEGILNEKKEKSSKDRLQTTLLIASKMGMEGDAITLRDIIAAMPGEEAVAMENLRQEFSQVLQDLTVQNETNRHLLMAQLETVGATIERMARTMVLGNNYNHQGGAEDMLHRVSLLDTTV